LRRVAGFVVVFLALSFALHAVELGRAEGTLTIDKKTVNLAYAYAINRQHNEVTNRRDDIKVVLTDKPLPPDVKLAEIDFNFPGDTLGVVIHISNKDKVTHVIVQHPTGTYDGGFTDDTPDFRFKPDPKVRGVIAGRVTSSTVKTNTMSFAVDAAFNALQQ
jgi:hypothetical protein